MISDKIRKALIKKARIGTRILSTREEETQPQGVANL
jgi:hypothetical protein